ncbi:MAG: DUF1376 domain-containing protein [Burkholderiaceae bacterium]|nr:MAG: DUF1376 domain-containing protein [Burkholderiaceae bacterium]
MMCTNLPLLSIDTRWVTESKWFSSQDAEVLRGGFLLIEAAFRSSDAGSLPGDAEALARISGIDRQKWVVAGDQLLHGFERAQDGRWRHVEMTKVLQAVQERFGSQLAELAASSVLASQAVDEFALTGEIKPEGRSKGKRVLPKDYAFSPALLESAKAAGFITPEHQVWLLERFRDFAQASKRLYSNWDATARNFMSSSITANEFLTRFGYRPRESAQRLELAAQGVQVGRSSGAQTFESAARAGSESAVDRVMKNRGYGMGPGSGPGAQDAQAGGARPSGFGFAMGARA